MISCSSQIEDIENCFFQYYANHDESFFSKLNDVSLSLPPDGSWNEISVEVVQKAKMISKQLLLTDRWIHKMFKEEAWMEADQAYELEIQMLSFYGVEACNLIDEIGSIAHIKYGDLSIHKNIFLKKIAEIEDSIKENADKLIIPVLRERFGNGVG
ncbi:MAG: hypothetical protein EOM56_00715 [Deltaproteobacteria bacterium]|nr:hypothetical protein [Deltaproteobacteria bacterium]